MTILFPLSYTTQSKIAVPLNEKSLAPKKEAKKAHIRTYEKENYYYMKIEKWRIGKTYYLPQRGCPTSYTSGVLVEIVSKNKVILENKKGNRFSCNTNKLQLTSTKLRLSSSKHLYNLKVF